ncbi:uncharacterized protein LOC110855685 [Folsomia candida]|uniref:Uncharacterized protein n=1 Tax=Folsomia candida TaxID=158441 RepID=A0A226DR65_FOLCA|nr:uncharacterized protein LOC110855685 [Folsomia candida]OXA47693.1 hypothetical protein Fcan01_17751 [Folsomia candida]
MFSFLRNLNPCFGLNPTLIVKVVLIINLIMSIMGTFVFTARAEELIEYTKTKFEEVSTSEWAIYSWFMVFINPLMTILFWTLFRAVGKNDLPTIERWRVGIFVIPGFHIFWSIFSSTNAKANDLRSLFGFLYVPIFYLTMYTSWTVYYWCRIERRKLEGSGNRVKLD